MNKHLSCKPQDVTNRLWYYEEPSGITVVHEIFQADGSYLRTDQIVIPWTKIRRSLQRKDKK